VSSEPVRDRSAPGHRDEGRNAAADAAAVEREFPAIVEGVVQHRGGTWLIVRPDGLLTVMRHLRDRLGYGFFSECFAVDYLGAPRSAALGGDHRFEVVYNLVAIAPGHTVRRLLVKVRVAGEDPAVPSVTEVFAGAGFPEREIYDMFGIRFEGHPDLRRLLMPDDWIGHPLRKDYPLGGERVQFPGGTYGPSVGERPVHHPGESFFGPTAGRSG
jgi:NADH-quinone oxidoreductase subunit C